MLCEINIIGVAIRKNIVQTFEGNIARILYWGTRLRAHLYNSIMARNKPCSDSYENDIRVIFDSIRRITKLVGLK